MIAFSTSYSRGIRGPLALLLVLTAAVSGCGTASPAESAPTAPVEQEPFAILPEPEFDSVASPTVPVRLTVTSGELGQVTLTNDEGRAVAGTVSADKTTWTATEPLGFGKVYTWTGKAFDADRQQYPISGSFTTLTPETYVVARTTVSDGAVYPGDLDLRITFSGPITEKYAVERAVSLATTPQAQGEWLWINDDTVLQWRPAGKSWQPGTTVILDAELYALRVGDGEYLVEDLRREFTIA